MAPDLSSGQAHAAGPGTGAKVPAGETPHARTMVRQSEIRGLATPGRCIRRRRGATLGADVTARQLFIELPRLPADSRCGASRAGRGACLPSGGHGGGPEEAGQFAGHGDVRHMGRLAAFA